MIGLGVPPPDNVRCSAVETGAVPSYAVVKSMPECVSKVLNVTSGTSEELEHFNAHLQTWLAV